MATKLERIAKIAKERPKERFTSLVHLINEESLREAHQKMKARKAPGVDDLTKADYQEKLIDNIENLLGRMKQKSYRPQPVLRRLNLPRFTGQLDKTIIKHNWRFRYYGNKQKTVQ